MKKVFVIQNTVTNTFGAPFVASSVEDALQAITTEVAQKDWSTTLAASRLYYIGDFSTRCGQLTRTKMKLVADSSDMLNVAAKVSKNVLEALNEAINTLSLLKDFYSEVSPDGSCSETV